MVARRELEDVDAELTRLLEVACRLREETLGLPRVTDAYRLVHAEADGFPGLVLDRLGDALVAQVFTLCMMQRIDDLGAALQRRYPKARLVLTADRDAAQREGFDAPPPARPTATEIVEHGVRFGVVPGHGHKTGFFADQRDNRALLRTLAEGRSVLDLCCHAGGFAINAALGKAKTVTAIDLDEAAVALARDNAGRNRVKVDVRHGDAFDVLRAAGQGAHDLIVLDPPKWIDGRGEIEQGLGRYLDLNRAALQKLNAGGVLVTCSCSGALSGERFEAMLRDAAAQARRDLRILHRRGPGPDHPIGLECPETGYLKVLVLQVR
jgi:23S rRNA (cytosine1962-C5)-methyltransferase